MSEAARISDAADGASNDNAVAVPTAITPAIFTRKGAVRDLIDRIKADSRDRATRLDVSTEDGRQGLRSLAYQVRRSKTALDNAGKDQTEEWRLKTNAINADRRVVRDELDALEEEVRAPLTAFENAEKTRVQGHEAAVAAMAALTDFASSNMAIDEIDRNLAALATLLQRDWQEFGKRATDTADSVRADLQRLRAEVVRREEERAELARLRAEESERKRQEDERLRLEREARIAEEAAAAAKRAAEEEAERLRQEEAARVERERQAAEEARRREAEAAEGARLAEERRAHEAEERAAQAERDRRAAIEKAETERLAGHERALAALIEDDGWGERESSTEIELRLKWLGAALARRDWEEFQGRAEEAIHAETERAQAALTQAKAREQAEAAEQARLAEEAAQKREQEAVEAERRRSAAAKDAEERAAAKRAANLAHQTKINRAVLAALKETLVAEGVAEESAEPIGKALVRAIAGGNVPHTTITY